MEGSTSSLGGRSRSEGSNLDDHAHILVVAVVVVVVIVGVVVIVVVVVGSVALILSSVIVARMGERRGVYRVFGGET
jgi:hypothetical protein